jgi:hypothetical protein
MTLEFASDSASAKLNLTIKTGDWFSGNTTGFGLNIRGESVLKSMVPHIVCLDTI